MGQQPDVYYQAARERMQEAFHLHSQGFYVLAIYVSSLAVECMLRVFRLLNNAAFDERHDLWLLWKSTVLADVHDEFYQDKIQAAMNVVRLLWRNDYRFYPASAITRHLKKVSPNRRIKGDILKYNSQRLYEASSEIIRLGVQKWKLLNRK